jgi:transposase-like protein
MPRFVPVEALFQGRHFDHEIVVLCVRWYSSYQPSSRDWVAMMAERSIGLYAQAGFHGRFLTEAK